ncbi:MAG: galactose mutarotase [Labilithrix sp.]|nr:galactose mutarotase [Labilithrix sp.]MCW5810859.1 galactose mutarotase [Labilithrix sp.]
MLPTATPLEDTLLTSDGATVYLAPARGGMATRFFAGERAVFYLDDDTLRDRSKNVRGGNPVLFPSPGKLEGDRWGDLSMGQHGFARNAAWKAEDARESAVTLVATSNDATMATYPHAFTLRFRYALTGTTLRIEQSIETAGPYGVGFHPYFFVPQADKARARIATPATRAWDNVKKEEIALGGPIDLTAKEVDLHLVDHGSSTAVLELPAGRVEVRGSPEYTRWVVWTVAGKDYVCLEPWTCPADALNTGTSLLTGPRTLWTEIAFSAS